MKKIKLDGVVYDISNFNHPGGSIINYAGQDGHDAGDAFKEFHARSEYAHKVLASLPKVQHNDKENKENNDRCHEMDEIQRDFRDMRKSLESLDCFEPDYIHEYFRLLELAFFFGMGIFLIPYNVYASMLSFIIFKTRCGWVQHEGGHLSLTGVKKIDHAIQVVSMGFGGGASSTLWNSMHHKHHAAPQKINYDIDLDTIPFVAFFEGAFENSNRINFSSTKKIVEKIARVWMRIQAWVFLPITNGILVHFFWTYYLHPQRVIRNMQKQMNYWTISEVGSIAASHTIIPLLFYMKNANDLGIIYCYILLMICNAFNFMYLFGHFSLSHTFTEVTPDNVTLKWFEYSIQHSVNISTTSPLVSWIMGYLNFQIEHHLFPSMPQYKNALAAKKVKEFCKKWSLEYNEVDYWTAWKKMFKNLDDTGKHYYTNGFNADKPSSSSAVTNNNDESAPNSVSEEDDELEYDKLKLD